MNPASDLDSILGRLEVYGVRLGLETTRRLQQELGDPQKSVRAVLVAGTNGKGSTAALLASMVQSAGYRVGLYTSPHLEAVEERLRIDGRAIRSESLVAILEEIVTVAEDRLGYLPTYFEALTAAAFLWFSREQVDLAVLEVGLGGRLDATNGCDPKVSLITEIGLEHQKYLGETLAQIGREKAGIVRAGRPTLAWVEREEARLAIEEVGTEIGARLAWGPQLVSLEDHRDLGWVGQQVTLRTPRQRYEISLPLLGEHQVANLGLAVLAAEELASMGLSNLDHRAIVAGVSRTRWPGRLEWVEPDGTVPILLDVAHNPDGASTLRRALDRLEGRCVMLFGALKDKQVERVLPILAERAWRVVLTSPASPRAADVDELAALVPPAKTLVDNNRAAALDLALAADGDFLVVCGSVYLVGEVRLDLRRRFGVPYPATDDLQWPSRAESPSLAR